MIGLDPVCSYCEKRHRGTSCIPMPDCRCGHFKYMHSDEGHCSYCGCTSFPNDTVHHCEPQNKAGTARPDVGYMWCCSCGQVWTYQWEWFGSSPWSVWLRWPFSEEDQARRLEFTYE